MDPATGASKKARLAQSVEHETLNLRVAVLPHSKVMIGRLPELVLLRQVSGNSSGLLCHPVAYVILHESPLHVQHCTVIICAADVSRFDWSMHFCIRFGIFANWQSLTGLEMTIASFTR